MNKSDPTNPTSPRKIAVAPKIWLGANHGLYRCWSPAKLHPTWYVSSVQEGNHIKTASLDSELNGFRFINRLNAIGGVSQTAESNNGTICDFWLKQHLRWELWNAVKRSQNLYMTTPVGAVLLQIVCTVTVLMISGRFTVIALVGRLSENYFIIFYVFATSGEHA